MLSMIPLSVVRISKVFTWNENVKPMNSKRTNKLNVSSLNEKRLQTRTSITNMVSFPHEAVSGNFIDSFAFSSQSSTCANGKVSNTPIRLGKTTTLFTLSLPMLSTPSSNELAVLTFLGRVRITIKVDLNSANSLPNLPISVPTELSRTSR